MYQQHEQLNLAQFERMLLRGDAESLRNNGFHATAAVASGSIDAFIPNTNVLIDSTIKNHSTTSIEPIALAQACLKNPTSQCVQYSLVLHLLRKGSVSAAYTIITAGVGLFSVFCRENWAGPPIASDDSINKNTIPDVTYSLAVDGEEIAHATRFLSALSAARLLLVDSIDYLVACGARLTPWWAARVLFTHTSILSGPAPSLYRPLFNMFSRFLGEQCNTSSEIFETPKWISQERDRPPSPKRYAQVSHVINQNQRIQDQESEDDDLLPAPCTEIQGDIRDEEDDFDIVLDENNPIDRVLMTLAYLELAIAQRTFYDGDGARQSLYTASKLEGIHFRIRGEMGVRTKFQQKPTAQLIARCFVLKERETNVKHDNVWMQLSTESNDDNLALPIPKNIPLDDSDALGYVKLVDEKEKDNDDKSKDNNASEQIEGKSEEEDEIEIGKEIENLTPIQQAIAIGYAVNIRARNASHTTTKEQMAPYVDLILRNEKSPFGTSSVIQLHALMLRVSFERERGRYLERCMSQMEEVGRFVEDEMKSEDVSYRDQAGAERSLFIYSSGIPPRWELQKQLAISFGRIGLVKSAMEIFKKLEFWDELVDCHRLIGNVGAAEAMVREQLKQLDDNILEEDIDNEKSQLIGMANFGSQKARQTRIVRRPRLLCVLGDITRNKEYYEKAWEESGCKYGRAKRSLARLCVEKEEWEQAVEHFAAALEVNGLYPEIWFTYGCSALQINNLQLAAHAFTRVVQLTPENGEAWNNLGRVLHEMGKGKEALKALCEAGKRKRDSWRIWRNVVQLAMELKSILELVSGMERLLELCGKDGVLSAPIGVAVLEIIRMSTSSSVDERALAAAVCKRLLKILKTCTSLVSGNASIWAAYAKLYELLSDNEGNMQKAFDCRLKQLRSLMVQETWKVERQDFRHMVIVSSELLRDANLTKNALNIHIAKQNIQSVINQTKEDFTGDEAFERLHQLIIER